MLIAKNQSFWTSLYCTLNSTTVCVGKRLMRDCSFLMTYLSKRFGGGKDVIQAP